LAILHQKWSKEDWQRVVWQRTSHKSKFNRRLNWSRSYQLPPNSYYPPGIPKRRRQDLSGEWNCFLLFRRRTIGTSLSDKWYLMNPGFIKADKSSQKVFELSASCFKLSFATCHRTCLSSEVRNASRFSYTKYTSLLN
jgi:hypothetical protein